MLNQAFYSSQDSLYSEPPARANVQPRADHLTIDDCPMIEEEERRVCVVGEAGRDAELVDTLMNHFQYVVLRSERGLEYRDGEDDLLFVMEDFETSSDFKYLHSSGKLIAGEWW